LAATALGASLVLFFSACGGGDSGADFCKVAVATDQVMNDFDNLLSGSGENMKASLETINEGLKEMNVDAPEAIDAELGLLSEALSDFTDVMSKNGYDLQRAVEDPQFFELAAEFNTPEYAAAEEKFEAYLDKECGLVVES
jgi:hypothetical protein